MSAPDPEMFKLCLEAAARALAETITQLRGAVLVAPSEEDRDAALAPLGGLDLALQHIKAIA